MTEHGDEPVSRPTKEPTEAELTPEGQAASEDAALERLLGALPGASEDYPLPAGHESAAASYVAQTMAEEGAGEPVEPEAAPEPAPKTEQPDDQAYRLAAAALRRDGWSTEDVALLPAERVIALGEKRRKVQDDVDAHYEELVQLRNRREAARENEARRGENEAEAPAGLDVNALAERLGIEEEGVQTLVDVIRKSQEPLLQRLDSTERMLVESSKAQRRAQMESARSGLVERFPQLKDADAMARVLSRMDKIEQTGGNYSDVRELMEDAVLLEYHEDIRAQAAERTKQLRTARANGQVTSPTPTREKPTQEKLSKEEIERRAFDLLMDESKPYEDRVKEARQLGM